MCGLFPVAPLLFTNVTLLLWASFGTHFLHSSGHIPIYIIIKISAKKTHQLPESNFPPLVSCGYQQAAGAGVEGSREDAVLHHFGHSVLSYSHALEGWTVPAERHQCRFLSACMDIFNSCVTMNEMAKRQLICPQQSLLYKAEMSETILLFQIKTHLLFFCWILWK